MVFTSACIVDFCADLSSHSDQMGDGNDHASEVRGYLLATADRREDVDRYHGCSSGRQSLRRAVLKRVYEVR